MKVSYSFLIVLFFILASCNESPDKETALPYIGNHDIAYEKTTTHQAGDTIYHTIPSFSYLTQDSIFLTSDDISDKIWIAKFFFTTCPTICPPMTASMKLVNDSLNLLSDSIVFLSFSIDPKKDTPSKLRKYINEHQISASNWYFLTGDEEETHELGVNGFQVHAHADDLAPGGFAHSANFVLVDKNKHIRGIYDGLEQSERERLIKDVNKLISNANR